MFVAYSELNQFDVVNAKAGMPPYVVSLIDGDMVTFTNDVDTFTDNTGQADLLNRTLSLKYCKIMTDFTIHATVAGQVICGIRSTQNSKQVDGGATCEKCLELINK